MKPREGIHVDETDTSLRLSWNNRTTAKQPFLGFFMVVWWIAWTPLTLFLTYLTFAERGLHLVMFLIGLILAWIFELGIPYALLSRRWRESIFLDKTAITLTFSGPFARWPRVIPLGSILEIWIGHFGSGEDRESIVTLNIFLSEAAPTWFRRQMVGYWLSYELKQQLFQAIEAFVEMHHLDIRCTRA